MMLLKKCGHSPGTTPRCHWSLSSALGCWAPLWGQSGWRLRCHQMCLPQLVAFPFIGSNWVGEAAFHGSFVTKRTSRCVPSERLSGHILLSSEAYWRECGAKWLRREGKRLGKWDPPAGRVRRHIEKNLFWSCVLPSTLLQSSSIAIYLSRSTWLISSCHPWVTSHPTRLCGRLITNI